MNLRSLFIREHDGASCGGGFCRHDKRCSDSHCAGHPSRNDDDMPTPEDAAGWLVWLVVSVASFMSLGLIAAYVASLP
jgi:hypothetical protein